MRDFSSFVSGKNPVSFKNLPKKFWDCYVNEYEVHENTKYLNISGILLDL